MASTTFKDCLETLEKYPSAHNNEAITEAIHDIADASVMHLKKNAMRPEFLIEFTGQRASLEEVLTDAKIEEFRKGMELFLLHLFIVRKNAAGLTYMLCSLFDELEIAHSNDKDEKEKEAANLLADNSGYLAAAYAAFFDMLQKIVAENTKALDMIIHAPQSVFQDEKHLKDTLQKATKYLATFCTHCVSPKHTAAAEAAAITPPIAVGISLVTKAPLCSECLSEERVNLLSSKK
jgi:hypothetical protein